MATIDLKSLLGTAIKSGRSQLGISQEELAYRAGLHRTYISDLERGARNPSIESVEKLARALQISVSMLFEKAIGANGTKHLVEILLVEDNPRDAKLTMRAFEKAQITNPLHVVSDGIEALDFVFATGPYADRLGGASATSHFARLKSSQKERTGSTTKNQMRQAHAAHSRHNTHSFESGP